MERIKLYVGCPEVRYMVDVPQGFVARCNFIMLHVWLIQDRLAQLLRDISQASAEISRFAFDAHSKKVRFDEAFCKGMQRELEDQFEENVERWMQDVKIHPFQRRRFLDLAKRHGKVCSFLLTEHFQGRSYRQLPEVLHSIFFPHRPYHSYRLFVLQMTDYLSKTREVFKTMTVEQFQVCHSVWDIKCIDPKAVQKLRQEFAAKETPAPDKAFELSPQDMETIEELDTILPEEDDVKVQVQAPIQRDEKYRPKHK